MTSRLPLTHCLSVMLLALPIETSPQVLPTEVNLMAAARQIRQGDTTGALLTLDRAEIEAVNQPVALARVHAYRAWAYLDLKQPSRAKDAARKSLMANRAIVIAAAEFPAEVLALFEEVRHPPGTIWVYLPQSGQAPGVKSRVLCDGQLEADLDIGRFIVFFASPGPHIIDFRDQRLSLTVESGEHYYFRGGPESSARTPRYTVRAVSKEDGAKEIFDAKMPTQVPGRSSEPCGVSR